MTRTTNGEDNDDNGCTSLSKSGDHEGEGHEGHCVAHQEGKYQGGVGKVQNWGLGRFY